MRLTDPIRPVRRGFTMTQLIGVILIVATVIGMVVPVIQKVREKRARTDSVNNLKAIGLAFHSFHNTHKRLPYNGTSMPYLVNGIPHGGSAIPGDFTTGSWAFQILPFLDHKDIFNRADTRVPVPVYMCPGRGRPALCTEAGGPGAWTDYFLNPFLNSHWKLELNEPFGEVDGPDMRATLVGITDGTSNTIFVGHGQIRPANYGDVNTIPGFSDVIFKGGSAANCRANLVVVLSRDSADSAPGNWGGPWSDGALMGLGGATVRLFPYSVPAGIISRETRDARPNPSIGAFLTPTGGESVTFGNCG